MGIIGAKGVSNASPLFFSFLVLMMASVNRILVASAA